MLCKLLQQIQLWLFGTCGIFFLEYFPSAFGCIHRCWAWGHRRITTSLHQLQSSHLFFFSENSSPELTNFFFPHCCDYVLFSPSPLNRLSLICWVNNDSFFKTRLEQLVLSKSSDFILVNDNVSSVGPIIMMQLWKQTYTHYTHTDTHIDVIVLKQIAINAFCCFLVAKSYSIPLEIAFQNLQNWWNQTFHLLMWWFTKGTIFAFMRLVNNHIWPRCIIL